MPIRVTRSQLKALQSRLNDPSATTARATWRAVDARGKRKRLTSVRQAPCPAPEGRTVYRVTLPMPPSVNRIWRVSKSRKVMYRPTEYVAFLNAVADECRRLGITPVSGPIRLDMDFYMARRNGDVSNRVKALEDALSGYAYDDDLQVVRHTDARHLDMDNPRVEVSVIALNASI